MINMQGFSLLDIMSKSYKKGMNEMDSAGVGIVGKSKSLNFSTNPNLYKIQTFLKTA